MKVRSLIALWAVLAFTSVANAAITQENAVHGTDADLVGGTVMTLSFTATAANAVLVMCGRGQSGAAVINSVTFNTTSSFTPVIQYHPAGWGNVEIWKLTTVPAVTANVVIVVDAPESQMECGVIGLIGVGTVGSGVSAETTGNNPTVNVTTTSGDWVLGEIANDVGSIAALSVTSPGIQIWEDEDAGGGDSDFGGQRVTATTTSTAVAWTQSTGGEHSSMAAVPVSPAAGASSIVPLVMQQIR